MAEESKRVLLVFLDGVGIGEDDGARNPLARARVEGFRELLGGANLTTSHFANGPIDASGIRVVQVDPNMDIDGLPQSGTGQTALLTGHNAASRFGRHFGPWVPTGLRPLLAADNLFAVADAAGRRVAFANAYPLERHAAHREGIRRPGAFPYAAASAGKMTRDEEDIRTGTALVSSIITDRWRQLVDPAAPTVTPRAAAGQLLALASDQDLTVFAHFDTDFVGHRGTMEQAVGVVERVAEFLTAVLEDRPDDLVVVVTSDHGNIEEIGAGHTRNPVPLLVAGADPGVVDGLPTSITGITPMIAAMLDFELTGWRPAGGD